MDLETCRSRLVRAAQRIAPADAEDAVHDVFARLLAGGRDLEDTPMNYLLVSVRHAALRYLRPEVPLDNCPDLGLPGPGEAGIELAAALSAHPALANGLLPGPLSPAQRARLCRARQKARQEDRCD